MTRRPALIFDFGNVIAFFDFTRASAALGRRFGLTGEALLEQVRGAGFQPLLVRYESGLISSEEFSRSFAELAGLEIGHDEFSAAWSDIFWVNEPFTRLVAALKARGYTVVLGSNTNELHATHFRQQFAATLAHFDRLVLSYEVGHVKPSRDFFLACSAAAGAEPGDCVFIDDLPENVQGSCDAGLRGVVYRDLPTLLVDLRRLGVEVPSAEYLTNPSNPEPSVE